MPPIRILFFFILETSVPYRADAEVVELLKIGFL
jgi:hypothetical protein